MIREFLTSAFLLIGTAFMLLGSIGLLRMPDFYTRMHAQTKCATLGLSCLLLAAIPGLLSLSVSIKVLLAVLFNFLTTPVGAHMIARAAYHHLKVPFWHGTIADEWTKD